MISGLRLMWMLVMFDLPVKKDVDRKRATKFRNYLLDEGFSMSQYSVYMRFCGTRERVDSYKNKIREHVPPSGDVCILCFTDKQYGKIEHFCNRKKEKMPDKTGQYLLFD
ncbi:MAG: CRISPR-associated endonuclease Cas2 [Candidatus Cloacimonetes bacterium]|nr:CRISPR-associated endonuclease Cas2 [Candidatus Cloacimonadota bacterium]